jgi:septal ring factor EnvC (AmiA/AmiB activator)
MNMDMSKPVKKRVGRPLKAPDPNEDPKKRKNREAQVRYKQKVGKEINAVVDKLDECEDERSILKDKVKGLTQMIKTCDDQVKEIMKAINGMPKASRAMR